MDTAQKTINVSIQLDGYIRPCDDPLKGEICNVGTMDSHGSVHNTRSAAQEWFELPDEIRAKAEAIGELWADEEIYGDKVIVERATGEYRTDYTVKLSVKHNGEWFNVSTKL